MPVKNPPYRKPDYSYKAITLPVPEGEEVFGEYRFPAYTLEQINRERDTKARDVLSGRWTKGHRKGEK